MTTNRPVFAVTDFRKAAASEPDQSCVRVARGEGWVEMRDDKTEFGAADDNRLWFSDQEFDVVLGGIRSGETSGSPLEMVPLADGGFVFRRRGPSDTELTFTKAEVDAFLAGVHNHEFDTEAFLAGA